MKCKECYFVDKQFNSECETTGCCPLEPTEEELNELDRMAHDWFAMSFTKGTRETIVKQYRALCRLNKALAAVNENVNLFDDILGVIEDLLPAYGREHIIDENGDINSHYHELVALATGHEMSDEEFAQLVLKED